MAELSENSSGGNKKFRVGFAGVALLAILAGSALIFSIASFAGDIFSDKPIKLALLSAEPPVIKPILQPSYTRYDFRLAGDETFSSIMSLFDVPSADIREIASAVAPVYNLKMLKKGSVFRVFAEKDKWKYFEYNFGDYSVLRVDNNSTDRLSVAASIRELPHELKRITVAGTIESSLYEDATKAGVDPHAIVELSEIFAWDVDFASDIKKGDSFKVVYEHLYVDGAPVRAGRVIGAEMTNSAKTYTAVYFDNGSSSGYYDPEGKSLSRDLLKSPLRYKRISSHFSRRRYHPILKQYREHHGIDYAAPTGTPIESAGSGRVQFAGWKSGYGNFIEVKHSNGYVTAYGHLSKIKPGIKAGAKVDQGSVIGYVGSTGISTGPHLHYEVRVNGGLINPLRIKPKANKALASEDLKKFNEKKGEVITALASVKPAVPALVAANTVK